MPQAEISAGTAKKQDFGLGFIGENATANDNTGFDLGRIRKEATFANNESLREGVVS